MNSRSFFESVCGPVRWRGEEGSAHCPLPEHGSRDKNPSFSVNAAQGTFYCHKEKIGGGLKRLAALTGRPLPEEQIKAVHDGGSRQIVATYDYTDASGALLYQTVRFSPKGFAQRRPDPDQPGGWLWNLNGAKPVPYCLPGLLEALAASEQVFIVEGEKDANRLAAWGLCATTNYGGAGKWQAAYADYFPAGAKVVLLPDNDGVGTIHMRHVKNLLRQRKCDVTLLKLDGVPEKGDVSDWIDAGHTKEELLKMLTEEGTGKFALTDVGNAERLAAQHADKLRYCGAWGKWNVWDGRRWEDDETGEACRRAVETVRSIKEKASQIHSLKRRKAVVQFAERSEAESRLRAMLKLGQCQSALVVRSSDFDTDNWLLNVENGTLDLRSEKLLGHDPARLITKLAMAPYDPAATCPTWEAFLERVFDGQQELIHYVQKAVGYSLTGECGEQCLFLLHGHGANGKSTFLTTLMTLLNDYARQMPMEALLARQENSIPNDLAALRGARFVSAVEADQGRRLNESKIKQMTGQDKIAARFMRCEWFEFAPQFKLWLATNHKPSVRGCDEAIWRRLRLIPFVVTIPPEERDAALPDKLRQELPGILRWAVEGCSLWQTEGLSAPSAVTLATDEYRDEMDIIGDYIKERCVMNPLGAASVADSYRDYEAWCGKNAEKPFSKRTFTALMREHGLQTKRGTGNVMCWEELALAEPLLFH
ncbi:MAG TPA: phage/plasmid primase, P4 family [Negativicutes bacterium]|nr:phage/plasmid primase, P4 family [Negativicutes bacterium]